MERAINAIAVGERYRKDLGDIAGLAASIEEIGLLHPIVIREDGMLIAGRRRLEACGLLGWGEVPVTVVDLEEVTRGEFAENVYRQDFLPSEAVAIWQAMESYQGENGTALRGESQRSERRIDRAANATGMGTQALSKANQVIKAAEAEPEKYAPLVQEMDATGKVDPAYQKLRMGVHYSSNRLDWGTPQDFFDQLDEEFGFTLDVCAMADTAKCGRYFSPVEDGLSQEWPGTCWMNPPYGNEIGGWVAKAYQESRNGAVVVCLIPSRTDTAWWHDYIMRAKEIRFVRGRLRFEGADDASAPFPSAVVVLAADSEGPPAVSTLKWSK